jgi:hypothetical protein
MTAHAWLVTTWGRIRETLQPELFALRRDLAHARDVIVTERELKKMAQQRANELSETLAQRSRELKAARAKVRQAAKVK